MYSLFYLRKIRINKKNESVVYIRLKQDKKIIELSTGFKGNILLWDNNRQLFNSNEKKYFFFNSKIIDIKKIIDDYHFEELDTVIVLIKQKLTEKEPISIITTERLLNDYLAYQLERTKLTNSKRIEKSSYVAAKTFVTSFKTYFNASNIFLASQINNEVIEKYLDWKGGSASTLSRANKHIKTIMSFGEKKYKIILEKIDQIIAPPKNEITYLTSIEQHKIESFKFQQVRLAQVRDVFVFQYLTGLSYTDLQRLTFSDVEDQGKRLFIFIKRQKTKSNCIIPIHDKALEIWKNYDFVLPILSNQKYNSYLKEIGEIVGIKKKLTTHLARRTAAMTLLNKGMRIDTIAAILGHENVATTARYYAKLTAERISEEYEKIYG